jgi:hypothetical protein
MTSVCAFVTSFFVYLSSPFLHLLFNQKFLSLVLKFLCMQYVNGEKKLREFCWTKHRSHSSVQIDILSSKNKLRATLLLSPLQNGRVPPKGVWKLMKWSDFRQERNPPPPPHFWCTYARCMLVHMYFCSVSYQRVCVHITSIHTLRSDGKINKQTKVEQTDRHKKVVA